MFLSHSSRDKDEIQRLRKALADRGVPAWEDVLELRLGDRFASRTGCGLLLDAYNLRCDVHNNGLDVTAFLDELDLSPVRELHLAGGVEHRGFYLDIHSNPTRDDTMAIGLEIIRRAPNLRTVTYEFLKEAVPLIGHDTICAELARIRQVMDDDTARTPAAGLARSH